MMANPGKGSASGDKRPGQQTRVCSGSRTRATTGKVCLARKKALRMLMGPRVTTAEV